MDTRKRWQYAIIISILLNFLLLCGMSIVKVGMLKTEPVEKLIELELVNDEGIEKSVDSSQGKGTSVQAKQMTAHTASVSSTPVVVQAVTGVDDVNVSTIAHHADDEIQKEGLSVDSVGTNGAVGGSDGLRSGSDNDRKNGNVGQGVGQGVGQAGGGISHPQILSQVDPTYPEAARLASREGTVLLEVQILENGRTGSVSIKQSSGNELLDESAVSAVYKWRFTPAKEKNTGRAIVCITTVPVVFKLN